MAPESSKKKAELKRQIITLSQDVQGPGLDKLTIEELQTVLDLHSALSYFIEKANKKKPLK